MRSERSSAESYRLFADEIFRKLQEMDVQDLGVKEICLREKEAFWECTLDLGRMYSSPVREFLDCRYDDRTITLDLQYAYGEYLRGIQTDLIAESVANSIFVAIKSDERNQLYSRECQELDFDR